MAVKAKEDVLQSARPVTEPAPTQPEPVVKKQIRYRGMESRLHLARSAQNEWVYLVDAGTPYDSVLKPDYWAAFAAKFTPYDRIEVRIEDGSWIGWLRVVDNGLNWVKVIAERDPLYIADRPSDRAVALDGHTLKWNGPVDKWAVIRDADRAKLQAGFQSRDAAMIWLSGHLKALAA